jgi:ATP-dependent protease ClpP protease subunit/cell division protein FtsB
MREIKLNGVVGVDMTLDSVRELLAGVSPQEELLIKISSPGGSVLTGFEIYNEIKQLPAAKKVFQINGIAASIATLIVLSGDEIEASEFSLSMIHKASTVAEGNAEQLAAQIEILEKINALLLEAYYDRNQKRGSRKVSREKLSAMMEEETWFTPEEAMEYGFVDRIVNKITDVTKIAAQSKSFDMNHLQRLKRLLAQGGKIEITLEQVSAAVTKALNGRQFSSLSDQQVQEFLVAVRDELTAVTGQTLTDQDITRINAMLEQVTGELREKEAASSTDGKIEALNRSIAELKNLITTVAETVVKNGQDVESLAAELVATQKSVRSFGRKPFVNEASKLNIGSAYVDPYARHRAEMAKIDEKTRIKAQ